MTTTPDAICVAARAKLATVATNRDAASLFIEHKTNQPFDTAPVGKVEAFEIINTRKTLLHAFGTTGIKEEQFYMVVRLGHGPFGKDYQRETYVSRDVDRIADIFEAYAFPVGTLGVWYEDAITNKGNPNWWVTELFFRVVLNSAIET